MNPNLTRRRRNNRAASETLTIGITIPLKLWRGFRNGIRHFRNGIFTARDIVSSLIFAGINGAVYIYTVSIVCGGSFPRSDIIIPSLVRLDFWPFHLTVISRVCRGNQSQRAAEAVFQGTAGCNAMGGDGRAVRLVAPAVLVQGEVQLAVRIFADHVFTAVVAGEDGAIVQGRAVRAGGELLLGSPGRHVILEQAHADAGILRQALIDGDGSRTQIDIRCIAFDLRVAADDHRSSVARAHAIFGVAGDRAAVHGKLLWGVHAPFRSRDGAAVHGKLICGVHAALHARDFSAVHGEFTARAGLYAVGERVFSLDRTRAIGITVAQGQRAVLIHENECDVLARRINQRRRKRFAVQTEVHITGNINVVIDRDVAGQVVVACGELVKALTLFGSCRPAVIQRLRLRVIGQRLPYRVAVRAVVRAALAANGVDMQVAVGEDDAVAVELLAVGAVAGEGLQVVLCQRVFYAIGNGEIAVLGRRARRGHANRLCPAGQLAADGDGLAAFQIDVARLAARRVAADGHIAGDGEGGTVHIHAAAIVTRRVAGDAAAVHGEPAARINEHTAAIALIAAADCVAGDAAAVHIKRAALHTHAAAFAVTVVFGILVAGNAAVVHGKGAGEIIHAAVISRDGTAVHLKQIFIRHAGTVSADAAAIHNESASFVYVHAGSFRRAGDRSVARLAAIAVAQRQRPACPDIDYIIVYTGFQSNAVPIQAEHEPYLLSANAFDAPSAVKRYVLRQVVLAGHCGQLGRAPPRLKAEHALLLCVAADSGALVPAGFSVLAVAAVVLMGQAVVEVDIITLRLDGIAAGSVGDDSALDVRCTFGEGGNGEIVAGVGGHVSSHADAGPGCQTGLTDGEGLQALIAEREKDIVRISVLSRVAGDVHGAGDGESSAFAHIHATAVVDTFRIADRVLGDAAAGHFEGAVAHIHAAAIAAAAGGLVVGDLTAIHIKYGAFNRPFNTYAAAIYGAVSGDAAAVHIKCAVHIHAAAGAGAVRDHARTAAALAVAEGKGTAILDGDRVKLAVGRNAVAVQAEHHAALGFPSAVDLNSPRQIVVSCPVDLIQTGNTLPVGNVPAVLRAARLAADGVIGVLRPLRQCRRLAEPLGQRLQLLRVFQLCLLSLGQGVIIRVADGLKRLVDLHGILIVHAVQFRRVRQSVDHRLHLGHGLVLLCGRIFLLFFLFRRLALLLRFRRLALLLRFRRLIFLLRFPVCRVCRFLHGRGRLRRPLRLLCQRRRGQQRQAQGQRHETAQDTLLHRSPPVRFLLCPNQSPTDRDLPVGSSPYGSGGAPGQFFSFRRSV